MTFPDRLRKLADARRVSEDHALRLAANELEMACASGNIARIAKALQDAKDVWWAYAGGE